VDISPNYKQQRKLRNVLILVYCEIAKFSYQGSASKYTSAIFITSSANHIHEDRVGYHRLSSLVITVVVSCIRD